MLLSKQEQALLELHRRAERGEPWQCLTLPCSNQSGHCGQHEAMSQHEQGSVR